MKTVALLLVVLWGAQGAQPRPKEFSEKYRQGIRWMNERQWQRAESAFVEALNRRESLDARRMSRICRFQIHLEAGERLSKGAKFQDAAEQFRRALDLDPGSEAAIEGLRGSQYESFFREGAQALAGREYKQARQAFRRCLEIRPDDTAALKQLQAVDAEAAAADRWIAHWKDVDKCLQAEDAACLDRLAPSLATAMVRHEAAPPNAALFPALRLYAQGDLDGAATAARKVLSPGSVHLQRLLRAQARRLWALRWMGWAGGLYGLTLACSIYFGVRQVRSRQLG